MLRGPPVLFTGKSSSEDVFAGKSSSVEGVLKKRPRWGCIEKCGACCYLKADEREELGWWLEDDERAVYEGLVGEDGWCKHFDKETRLCGIYETRPKFCRVEPKNFQDMFGVYEKDLDTFCTACCREHIHDVYGTDSDEIQRFNNAIKLLRRQHADDIRQNKAT